jgi:hypothetical protein
VTTQPHGVGKALQSTRLAVHARVLIKKIQIRPVSLLYRLSSVLLQHCLRVSACPIGQCLVCPNSHTGRGSLLSGIRQVRCVLHYHTPLFLVSFDGRKTSLLSFLICRQSALVNKRKVMAFFSKSGDSGMNSNQLKTQARGTFSFRGLIMTPISSISPELRRLRGPSNTQLHKSSY